MGSGSLVMAAQVQTAVRKRSPLLIVDEDRAAANLLVGSCLQAESVTPLSRIIAERRDAFGETAILFAAGALDLLTAQADRILLLERHEATYVDRAACRETLRRHLIETIQELALPGETAVLTGPGEGNDPAWTARSRGRRSL
jgi:predicted ABC-class ATPase